MPRKITKDNVDQWVELRGRGHTFQKIGEETGWNPETVRTHVSGQQEGEGEAEPAVKHFEFYKQGGTAAEAVIEFGEPFETAEKYWGQWRTANEDGFKKEIEGKDIQIQRLKEDNYLLREANASLRQRLVGYERRLSSTSIFREMILLRTLRDMNG